MNFKIGTNLMKLPGAQILNITSSDGKNLGPCIVIPAKFNDMLRTKEDGTVEVAPYLNLRAWSANQSYVNACTRNHAGEQNYVPPTHTLNVQYSQDFVKLAEASAAKRLRKENPQISEEELLKQAKYACNITLGDMTPIGQVVQPSYAVSGNSAVASAPDAQMEPQSGEANPEEDLPF